MASAIDPTKPVTGNPTTQSVRDNFLAAKNEIEALQTAISNVSAVQQLKYSMVGNLADITSTNSRWYPDRNITLQKVYFSIGTAPTSTVIIDVLKNNTSIFTGSKPTCTAGNYKSSEITVSTTLTTSDYLKVVITQPGGADATLCIIYQ